ncbi:MAG: hypothetical protein H6654_04865 [Ardenticatenaceae bacterium]|nr:hypothetical protein [Anaerolineales bacterium]MCB8941758.1 hypothetical protein [Ardenticatenaceae bacterium]MCB8972869.1 hypothetical protein [Ardenticatenaceae bacterium]
MSIITTLVLILMFFTPTVSVMAVMLQSTNGRQRSPAIIGMMILFAIGIHLLGARGLINTFLTINSSSALIATIISTIVALLLGVALGLLVQDFRKNKP